MEPMNLGSPGGSPITHNNQSAYLPSFLMGENETTTTPRSNTLSPRGTGRAFGCVNSAGASSADFNRSVLAPNALNTSQQQYQQYQAQHYSNASHSVGGNTLLSMSSYPGTPTRNASHQTGPPTVSLFDSLRNERNQVQTSPRGQLQQQLLSPTATQHTPLSAGNYSLNQSYQPSTQFNDSYGPAPPNAFNGSMRGLCSPLAGNISPLQLPEQRSNDYADFWVTIFGFLPGSTSLVLQHFSLCGTIVDKVLAPGNGNWIHVRFASRMECDKAINYNHKFISANTMIGVTRCTDRTIIDKENDHTNQQYENRALANDSSSRLRVRPLAQQAYMSAVNDSAVSPNRSLPQKSNGLVDKAIDLLFGW